MGGRGWKGVEGCGKWHRQTQIDTDVGGQTVRLLGEVLSRCCAVVLWAQVLWVWVWVWVWLWLCGGGGGKEGCKVGVGASMGWEWE